MGYRRTIVLTSLLTTVALSACFIFSCGFDMCGNEELQTITSPDGKHKAVVFQRDCGATTGFSTQISLLRANERLAKAPGNAFIADTDHGKAPAGPGGGPEVNPQWASENELVVRYDKRARVFEFKQSVDGVMIRYEQQ